MDIAFNNDQIRSGTGYYTHDLAALKYITQNLIRMDQVRRMEGNKARRLVAATSNNDRAELFGLA